MNEELESYFGRCTESLLNLRWLPGPKQASENWNDCMRFYPSRWYKIPVIIIRLKHVEPGLHYQVEPDHDSKTVACL
jgi:hypothetical protein